MFCFYSFNENICLKEKLHELRESLIHYQKNSDSQLEISRRVGEIAGPLHLAVNNCLENVQSLIENLSVAKKISSNLLNFGSINKPNSSNLLEPKGIFF